MKRRVQTLLDSGFDRDARSVSPVISVILMVAITVILAAVIATFVLGIGESTSTEAPSTAFEFEYDEDTGDVTVIHAEGEIVNGDQLRFAGAALDKTSFGDIWSGDVTSGATADVNVEAGKTLQVVWQNEDKTNTAILGEYEVPDDATASGAVNIDYAQSVNDEAQISITSLSKAGGSGYLVVETDAGDSSELPVSSGDTKTASVTIDPGGSVTATVYETSNKNNELDSDSGSPTLQASIGNLDTDPNNDGTHTRHGDDLLVENLRFNNTDSDSVFVVLKDDPNTAGDAADVTQSHSTYGGDLTFSGSNIADGSIGDETLTIEVYESQSDYTNNNSPIITKTTDSDSSDSTA